ncbi:MAG: ATP-dependent sacrificial sulfur transferase LarE [Tannerellaceae bacterium]|nr:ATP-dependent sacrificial sulfur transferase LarE [Tannerellaceae bacterium]
MEKLECLRAKIAAYGSLCVAYSGGVDSSFLIHVAYEMLGDKALAVLVDSPVLARRDKDAAVEILQRLGVRYEVVGEDPFVSADFAANSTMRCYFCKKNNYTLIKDVAERNGLRYVADGQNADDALSLHRPGIKAGKEMGVQSPLAECGLTKDDIRRYSKLLGVTTWNKPANACLSSRIPYGSEITAEKLAVVEAAEEVLREQGMESCRVRWHGTIARIEAPREYFDTIVRMPEITERIKSLGFKYITLDLEGFRSGSMNG